MLPCVLPCLVLDLPLVVSLSHCQVVSKVQVPILAEAHLVAALAVLDDFSVAVHAASSPVWTYVSPASYWHILDTLAGDLQLATSLPSQPCMA